ncbi:glycerate kinase [Chryseomicrobium aureum]|uniref:glycerate kinase n=1 Tax=Chryseomicrobium aureum TaxID=1441723 RepID=UPI00195D03D6|nr:glycerate kinase [Chryseomicrobium aureum]
MNIIIAPDSFKGSASAINITKKISEGVTRVYPYACIKEIPLADGGEGTLENMVYSTRGKTISVEVHDPLMRKIRADYGILGDQETVIIEMAQASGLTLLSEEEKNPLLTSTFGTGELIRHALDKGYKKFVIGLGGSATNDGGMGLLKALGVKFYNSKGIELGDGGESLINLSHYDSSGLDNRLLDCSFIIACDVTNKLCGPNGASEVFGPQKGASLADIQILDLALNRYAEVVEKQQGINVKELTGGGAAGGLGAALMAFLNASVKSGIKVVMEYLNFEEVVKNSDLIITGEGRLDAQTLGGKVIKGVSDIGKKYNIPVIALCGEVELKPSKFDELGLLSAFSILPGPCSLNDAILNTLKWIPYKTEAVLRVLKYVIIPPVRRNHNET